MKPARPLRQKVNRLLGWIGLTAFVSSAALAVALEFKTHEANLADALQSRVKIVRTLIERHIQNELLRLERFARELGKAEEEISTNFLEQATRLHGSQDVFYLLTPEGVISYAPEPYQEFIGLDFSHLPLFADRQTLFRVQQSLLSRRSVVILLMQVPDGRYLVMEKNLDAIVPLVEHFEQGKMIRDEQMFVLARDGTVAYHPNRELVRTRHNLGLELTDWSAASDYDLKTFQYLDRRYIGYQETLDMPSGWTSHYAVPYALLIKTGLQEAITQFLVLALVFLLLFRALMLLLNRYFSAPVADIVGALQQYELRGKGEVVARSSSRKILEFEQIIDTVNELSKNTRMATEQLEEREEMFRTVTENDMNLAFWRRPDGGIRYITPSCERITGYCQDEFYNDPDLLERIIHPSDRALWLEHTHELTASGNIVHLDFRLVTKSGETRWIRHFCKPILSQDGQLIGHRSSNLDITGQKKAEDQLVHNAFYDMLTGLANRSLLTDRLEHAIQRRKRDEFLFAVLYMDLDRFKVINDSLGHMIGDQLLIAVGDALTAQSRPGDTVSRLGGDEFVVLLDSIASSDDALNFVERVRERIRQPFALGNYEVFTSASIGVAYGGPSYARAEDILRDADTAMYQAKSDGRDRSKVFDHRMHAAAVARLDLETDLRRAIERNELINYYQPIIDLSSGDVHGVEALVRWQHPRRGLLGPLEFVPLAEETGLILALGEQVLRLACAQASRWYQSSTWNKYLMMHVNLSGIQLSQPGLVELVKDIIEDTQIAPEILTLEVTESVLMKNVGAARQMLADLQLVGVRLSMDDFGTGYSSLSHLREFPFNSLKIERSFIKSLDERRQDKKLLHSIIDMAHHLGLEVVAEGVETQMQLDLLNEMECNFGQGYLFSRPAQVTTIDAYLDEHRWMAASVHIPTA